ncbi:hypothetical protein OG756_16170 [Streptomyces sp. NBC_01310]|uniref:hypothetical protein n=1 Tax=Streptomyces sp. NBC_01310 TaxID=2903820 RepID=UPI0035B6171D|nr:hypothetical protein OG756_16170 [Streptomyces sp. NBC_01310]
MLLVLQGLLFVGAAPPALAGDDQALEAGFEPHNATANPRRPSQVAVMRGCTVRIDNNFGKDGFPITRTTTALDDTVGAQLSVDGGPPSKVPPPKGDELIVRGGSPEAVLYEVSDEKSAKGSVFVKYPRTTGTETRIDFTEIEDLEVGHGGKGKGDKPWAHGQQPFGGKP